MIPVSQPTLPDMSEITGRLEASFTSGHITNSHLTLQFEEKLAALAGVKHAVATSSNTLGMVLTWKSFGFPAGSEVVLPSFTFPASAHALTWNNLTPRFVDIDPATYLLDPSQVANAITSNTVAVLAVSLWGNPCDAHELEAIAQKHGLKLIFDSAQGMGSLYNGRPLGFRGDAEVFSFSPTKLITTGEGGAVLTDSDDIAHFVRRNRNYGLTPDYDSTVPGLNARMSEMHAALGLSCFGTMAQAIEARLNVVERYTAAFSRLPGISFQKMSESSRGNGVYYGIFIDHDEFGTSRDEVAETLQRQGIQTRRYGSPPLHQLSCYQGLTPVSLPVTERAARQVLVLPLFTHITDAQVEQVISAIESCCKVART